MTDFQNTRSRNLGRLLAPGSIAIVGASNDLAKPGAQAVLALSRFPGNLYPVNPKAAEILGHCSYPSLADLPEAPDLVILAVPAGLTLTIAEQAAQLGVGGLFVISGGFAEASEDGRQIQDRLTALCQTYGIRLLGPNTSGFLNLNRQCLATFAPGMDEMFAGPVGVVAQSGGVNLTIAFLLRAMNVGVSVAVGLGNAADIDAADIVDFLANDPGTHAIALHLEGVADGRRLYNALARTTRRKPVVVFPVGRSDVGQFAMSHTGNLMGVHRTTVSAMQQAGAVVVNSSEELALAAAMLSANRLPPLSSPGIAVITGQAGPGLIIADALKSAGILVPELAPETIGRLQSLLPPLTYVNNPVDTGRPGATFKDVIVTAMSDPAVHAGLVFALDEVAAMDPEMALPAAVHRVAKPVSFASLGTRDLEPTARVLARHGIMVANSPDQLAACAITLAKDSMARYRRSTVDPHDTLPPAHKHQERPPLALPMDEVAAKALLAAYDVQTPRCYACASRAEAHEARARVGSVVVVKILSGEILHKSDVGGVHVGVRDAQLLDLAIDAIDRISTVAPKRYLIEEMINGGVELLIGAVRDPSWGLCVTIGLGGVLTEVMNDGSVRLAPVGLADVETMLADLKCAQLLRGFRGGQAADFKAIAQVVFAIQSIMADFPEITELEINPLIVNGNIAIAVDALVSLREANIEDAS